MLALSSIVSRWLMVDDVRALRLSPRVRVIEDECFPELGPMLIRYFVLRTPLFAIFLHHFRRSDNDRHVHDHPWSFVTLLLSGGYWEHLPDRTSKWRKRFSILYRPAEWQHWVEIEKPVWTLVLRLRRRREWGFVTPRGWINHSAYGAEWCEEFQSANVEKSQAVETPEGSDNVK